MRGNSQKDKDLEEIFAHIAQIKQDQFEEVKREELEPIKIIQESSGKTAGELEIDNYSDEDIFEVLGPVNQILEEKDEFIEQPTTKVDEFIGSVGLCDICGTGFLFQKNLSGLVIHGKFFACETCCKDASKEDLDIWSESKMAKPADVKPIALWLMQHENKTRLIE